MRVRAASFIALSCLTTACAKQPMNRDVVSDVELTSEDTGGEPEVVDPEEVLSRLATSKSPKLLIFALDYEVFDETVLARDLQRIERYYRARGYYEAKVVHTRVVRESAGSRKVRVQIRIREGAPVLTKTVSIPGLEQLPFDVATAALRARRLEPGEPFDETHFEDTEKAIAHALADRGYAFVQVAGKAKVDIARHEAIVLYEVVPGPLASYGPIRISGLKEVPEEKVRANLLIEAGQPYSRTELQDAQNALINLGVFASVQVRPDTTRPETRIVPIEVALRESTLRAVRLGGGVRADNIHLENYLRVGWEDRNFLGGLRQFSIEARPGLNYFPASFGNLRWPTRLLPENRVRGELRQRAFLEGRTTGFLGGEYNVYPLLYDPEDLDPDAERIIGYHEVRTHVGLERAFFNHHLYITPSYNWQANFAFAYQRGPPPDALIEPVRVAFPELLTVLDFRDDPLHPKRGVYLSNSLQVARTFFGGSVSDLRIRPEIRLYHSVLRRKITLTTRAVVGLLFPQNYGNTLKDPAFVASHPEDTSVIKDQHRLLFRAFYSGGANSNRGYSYRGVGPHGPIGFLVPTGLNCTSRPDQPGCIRPLGGLTLWEASFEVRFPVSGPLSMVTFVDTSDVTRSRGHFRFNVPHMSVGSGIRYDTAVGPLRFDLGYRIPGMQKIGSKELPAEEGLASELFGIKGLDAAIHLAFGEAW